MLPCKINIIGEDSMSWILNIVNNTDISLSIQPFKLNLVEKRKKTFDNWYFYNFYKLVLANV